MNEWMYSIILELFQHGIINTLNILQVISELENNLVKVSQLLGDGISDKSRLKRWVVGQIILHCQLKVLA